MGNFLDMGKAGSVHEYLMLLHEKYGSIAGFWWGKKYVVSLASPEYCMKTNFQVDWGLNDKFDSSCKIAFSNNIELLKLKGAWKKLSTLGILE